MLNKIFAVYNSLLTESRNHVELVFSFFVTPFCLYRAQKKLFWASYIFRTMCMYKVTQNCYQRRVRVAMGDMRDEKCRWFHVRCWNTAHKIASFLSPLIHEEMMEVCMVKKNNLGRAEVEEGMSEAPAMRMKEECFSPSAHFLWVKGGSRGCLSLSSPPSKAHDTDWDISDEGHLFQSQPEESTTGWSACILYRKYGLNH